MDLENPDLKSFLENMETRITHAVQKGLAKIYEDLLRDIKLQGHQTELNLLTEAHRWAKPAEVRNLSISSALRAIDLELEAIDDRMKEIEARQAAGPSPTGR